MAIALPPLPRLIGHRGAAAYAPENTLASIRKAATLGARWVEFDVRLTADDDLVLMHDETAERTTGMRARVRDLTAAALAALDAGSWFGGDFAGERVPNLAAAIDLLRALGVGANIEIKSAPAEAAATAAVLARLLAAHWPAALPPPLISSFEVAALEAMQAAAPDWPRGLLLQRLGDGWRGLADRLGAATLNLDHRPLDAATVAAARESGRPVLCYTVNDAGRARDLFAWGVTGVFTDRPDLSV
ncbi:MAG: glycerophosphodiester phosphodiesterase [Rhodospirillaceae bacterium]|nr:glycerophosphodiester phosphodiesterase [Rhodospirillaceae bacterium]